MRRRRVSDAVWGAMKKSAFMPRSRLSTERSWFSWLRAMSFNGVAFFIILGIREKNACFLAYLQYTDFSLT